MEHKEKVIALFVNHGARAATRRALLALLPNGDWRFENVQFYTGSGLPLTDRGVILEHVTQGLILALSSAQPHVYNRSKWTGGDIAVDDLGVFEAVHRLLSTTYARFCAAHAAGPRAARLMALGASLARQDQAPQAAGGAGEADALEAPGVEGEGDVEGAAEGGAAAAMAQASEAGAAAAGAGEGSRGAGGGEAWAQEAATTRRQAMKFLSSQPFGHLVLMRLIMEPLRQLLAQQFEAASETRAWAARASFVQNKLSSSQLLAQLPLVSAALGERDRAFLHQVHALASEQGLWSLMPWQWQTGKGRQLAFRCVSRMGCSFHKLMLRKHSGFPYPVFKPLVDPTAAATVVATRPCLQDAWTRALLQKYPNLDGAECQQVLYTVATSVPADISALESRHASVRRLLYLRSTHTHALGFPDLSAQWVFQQVRTARQAAEGAASSSGGARGGSQGGHGVIEAVVERTAAKTRTRTKRKAQAEAQARNPKKRRAAGFGGPWRAYVRLYGEKYSEEGKLNFSRIAEAYRAAKASKDPTYRKAVQVGQLAHTARKVTGSPGFGPRKSQALRSRRQLGHWGFALQLQAMEDVAESTKAFALAHHVCATGATVPQALSMARMAKRAASLEAAAEARAGALAMAAWSTTQGTGIVRALREACPALTPLPMEATPTPCGIHVTVKPPSPEDLTRCISWAKSRPQTAALGPRLERQWDLQHQAIMEQDCREEPPAAPAAPAAAAKASEHQHCFAAGMCLCTEEGVRFKRLANKLLKLMKQRCPQGSQDKASLIEGKLVARLIGRPKSLEALLDVWLHIGFMLLSPYEPTCWRVQPVPSLDEWPLDPARVYVAGLEGGFCSIFQALQPLVTCDIVSARWYQLEDSARAIASFRPMPVPLRPMHGSAQVVQFWPRASRAAAGLSHGSEEDAEGDAEGEDEGLAGEQDDDAGFEPEPEGDVAEGDDEALEEMLRPLLEAYDEGDVELAHPDEDAHVGEPEAPLVAAMEEHPAPPPPPPVAAPPSPAASSVVSGKRRRLGLELSVAYGGGMLMYYPSNGNYEARCLVHSGQRCTLTRRAGLHQALPSSGVAPGRGRPLGFLAAWLDQATLSGSKGEHKAPELLKRLASPEQREYRYVHRLGLAAQEGTNTPFEQEAPSAAEGLELEPLAVA